MLVVVTSCFFTRRDGLWAEKQGPCWFYSVFTWNVSLVKSIFSSILSAIICERNEFNVSFDSTGLRCWLLWNDTYLTGARSRRVLNYIVSHLSLFGCSEVLVNVTSLVPPNLPYFADLYHGVCDVCIIDYFTSLTLNMKKCCLCV